MILLSLLVVLQTATDSLERGQVRGALGEALDARLAQFADSGLSGTVLVVRQRKIVLLKGYGLADTARGVRNGPATRFDMNSMTKMFTAAAILALSEAGRLRLDDPVERYLGEFPADKRGATVAHLAAHTSGLIVAGTPLAGDTRQAYLRDVKNAPRESAPGAAYRYTNAGYSLLALIVERASGDTFETYLRRRIFTPAGMSNVVFRNEIPAGDTLFARPRVGTANPYVWGTRGAGGVWCTVADIYRWIVALEEGRVLGEAHRTILFTSPPPPSDEAYGWHVRGDRIDKGGGSAAFASQLLYFPASGIVIVWASNDLRRRWRQTLNQAISELVLGASVP